MNTLELEFYICLLFEVILHNRISFENVLPPSSSPVKHQVNFQSRAPHLQAELVCV